MQPETNVIRVNAFCHSDYDHLKNEYTLDLARPLYVEITMILPTQQEAVEFAARFPKSLGIKGTRLGGMKDEQGNYYDAGYVAMTARLTPTKGNARNETGIRRYRRAMALLEQTGIEIQWAAHSAVNKYDSREQFEAAIS